MATMTGIDCYEALLKLQPEMAQKLVFLTGGVVTQMVDDFLHTVTNPRVDKPFDAAGLRETLQQLLRDG